MQKEEGDWGGGVYISMRKEEGDWGGGVYISMRKEEGDWDGGVYISMQKEKGDWGGGVTLASSVLADAWLLCSDAATDRADAENFFTESSVST
jgi:hypothetical protein